MGKLATFNPAKKRAAPKRKTQAVSKTTQPKRRRRAKKNPIGGEITKQMLDSIIGAGGALATDVVVRMLPLPDTARTGYMADLTKAAVAIGIGYGTEKLLKQRQTGRKLTEGSLTVIAYNIALRTVGPNLGLPASSVGAWDDFGYQYPGVESSMIQPGNESGMGAYMNSGPIMGQTGLGAYLRNYN